ncbi:hypothetical protein ACQP1G_06105 [Nocardia sp. CA-107356]|uniref:hypothetical protein n=1 Tax=Nocardia sp. CA-107356 TaxID=3239972 RepID=UPI003D917C9A
MDENSDRRAAFEAALGSEYFALQGVRASSISEAGTRASLFFTTLTGTLLALGFLAGTTDAVAPVAYASVPIVIVLGTLSFLRLVDIAIEDVVALQAMQRIRTYYAEISPEAAAYFPMPRTEGEVNTLLDTGASRARWKGTLTTAAAVGTVVSLTFGAATAFALADLGAPVTVAVVFGIVIAIVFGGLMFRYQDRRFVQSVPD